MSVEAKTCKKLASPSPKALLLAPPASTPDDGSNYTGAHLATNMKHYVLPSRQRIRQLDSLECTIDPFCRPDPGRGCGDVVIVHENTPAIHWNQAGNPVEEGSLSSAIRADD
jgi:hypothetical protein